MEHLLDIAEAARRTGLTSRALRFDEAQVSASRLLANYWKTRRGTSAVWSVHSLKTLSCTQTLWPAPARCYA